MSTMNCGSVLNLFETECDTGLSRRTPASIGKIVSARRMYHKDEEGHTAFLRSVCLENAVMSFPMFPKSTGQTPAASHAS